MTPLALAYEDAVLAVADDGRYADARDTFGHLSLCGGRRMFNKGVLTVSGLGQSIDGEEGTFYLG